MTAFLSHLSPFLPRMIAFLCRLTPRDTPNDSFFTPSFTIFTPDDGAFIASASAFFASAAIWMAGNRDTSC